jgi:hypothetical protein
MGLNWNSGITGNIHTENVDVDSKIGVTKICTVVSKTVDAEGRTDTISLSVRLAQFTGRMQRTQKIK